MCTPAMSFFRYMNHYYRCIYSIFFYFSRYFLTIQSNNFPHIANGHIKFNYHRFQVSSFDYQLSNPSFLLLISEFEVGMTCDGCASACKRILLKIDGVESVEADVPNKKLFVNGTADPDEMLQKLEKWSKSSGKYVRLA